MVVFLNGQFVPEHQAVVSVFDRSFLYGDGLFETLLVDNSTPFRWGQHLARLQAGAAFLNIALPFAPAELTQYAGKLIQLNEMSNGLLRLTLSRGVGRRGYSPRGADSPVLVMSAHASPDLDLRSLRKWQLVCSELRLPAGQALAQYKTCNKLAQVMARAQADQAGADEALLANTEGFIVEGASSNLFWVDHNTICTPPLVSGILSGVTRSIVLELCNKLGLSHAERNITGDGLLEAEGAFLSLSSYGVVEAVSLDGKALRCSPVTRQIHEAYAELVRRETG